MTKKLELKFEDNTIHCFEDPTYSTNSTDNIHGYDLVFCEDKEYRSTVKYGIFSYIGDTLIKSAIIFGYGGATSIHKDTVLLMDSSLILCICDSVVSLSLPELSLNWQKKCDDVTCFRIFPFENDFLIHGELTITRIRKTGEIVWQRSGSDIFVLPNGGENLKIENGVIFAESWDGRKYRFKGDGTEF